MHPNCRCSTVPYIPEGDYNKWLDGYKEHGLSFEGWKKKNKAGNVNFSSKPFSHSKSKTAEELLTMTRLGDKIINKHTSAENKWSGKVNRLIDDGNNYSGKEWNCDITLLNTASIHQSIHELLHARSISHYEKNAPDIYRTNRPMEELTVELFTKEILNAERITEVSSRAYGLSVKRLRMINRKTEIYSNDYEFAKELFEIPLVEREQWLRDKIFENSKTLVDYNRIIKYLEKVLKWR